VTDSHNTRHRYFYIPIPQSGVIGMMLCARMVGPMGKPSILVQRIADGHPAAHVAAEMGTASASG
jgi:hypothetical protein